MAYQDLREYLHALDKEGQLIHLSDEVWLEPDIRNISREVVNIGPDCPGVIIENIKGYKGKRVAVNLHGGWANSAIMLGMEKTTPPKEQFLELCKRWDNYEDGEIQWYHGSPPCQEVVITENINLYETIPLYRINPYDGGFYFSKACIVTKDIEDQYNFEKVNLGTYRVQVHGPDTLALQGLAFHDISVHVKKAETFNKPLPISICLGVDPILSFVSNAPVAYDQAEYKYASALSGAAKILARGITNDLPIPIGAEYVIEGDIVPRVRVAGGPFGEFAGSYSEVCGQYRIKVKAVTHRRNPIFENLYLGKPWTEIDTLRGLNTSLTFYKCLSKNMPEIKAVNAIQHGLTIVIAADNRSGRLAESIATTMSANLRGIDYCKNIILVDTSIDPFDLNQVMWALSSRVRPDEDIIKIPCCSRLKVNPVSKSLGLNGKVVIDATTSLYSEPIIQEVSLNYATKSEHFKNILTRFHRQNQSKSRKVGSVYL